LPIAASPQAALLVFNDPQLRRPVRESQAQALKVGITGADLRFDCRNLLVAPFDSNRIL
jgi:hypothetical protein